MKFRFIGTCAHDYSPELETKFKNCLDMDARRSSSALVEGHILIDCGHHTLDSMRILKIPHKNIDVILLTYLHDDHYNPESISKIANSAERILKIYVGQEGAARVQHDLEGSNVAVYGIYYLEKVNFGSNICITALPANHTEYPVHYLIEIEGKKIYYALDGAWIMYDALYALKDKRLDLLVLDGTVGDYEGDWRVAEHNSIPMIRMMLKSFREFHICDQGRIYISHIAPSLHRPHEEIVRTLKYDGIEVAFDGLEIEI